MYKKILALTLAGAVALPLAFSQNADAASQSRTCPPALASFLNPLHVKVEKTTDLSELLKELGLSVNFNDLLANPQALEQFVTMPDKAGQAKRTSPKQSAPAQKQTPAAPVAKAPAPSTEKQTGSSSSAASTPTSAPKSNSQMNAFENKVVELTNQERAKAGLKPLQATNDTLARMARDKSADMRDKNYFDHQSPTFGSPFDMMKKYGISYSYAGENIAAGQKTPEDVMTAWMNSPGHRANILNPNYTTIGVGYVSGGSYGSYWTQEFIGN